MADEHFWTDLRTTAALLKKSKNTEVKQLSPSLAKIVADANMSSLASTMVSLSELGGRIDTLLKKLGKETDDIISENLKSQLRKNRHFLKELATFLDASIALDGELDELETDEDEGEPITNSHTPLAAAMAVYIQNVRNQALRINRRTLNKMTKTDRIAEWINDRILPENELQTVDESLQVQAALRRFLNPLSLYINGIAARYRDFRKLHQATSNWYISDPIPAKELGSLEIDIILLCTMRTNSYLLQERTILRNIDTPTYALLKEYMGIVKNQVVIDEATDFSPMQLACMAALSNPEIQSFFACGDFNQRITDWGSRSVEELYWACPRLEIRPIQISYHHSRQLSILATEIVRLCVGETVDVVLQRTWTAKAYHPCSESVSSNVARLLIGLKGELSKSNASQVLYPLLQFL